MKQALKDLGNIVKAVTVEVVNEQADRAAQEPTLLEAIFTDANSDEKRFNRRIAQAYVARRDGSK